MGCNGYDRTSDITKAQYSAEKDTLSGEAASDPGQNADLEPIGSGAVKWNRKKAIWTLPLRRADSDPAIITVSAIEGTESILTQAN